MYFLVIQTVLWNYIDILGLEALGLRSVENSLVSLLNALQNEPCDVSCLDWYYLRNSCGSEFDGNLEKSLQVSIAWGFDYFTWVISDFNHWILHGEYTHYIALKICDFPFRKKIYQATFTH